MREARKPKASLLRSHGVDHIGITVPDTEKAAGFFVDGVDYGLGLRSMI